MTLWPLLAVGWLVLAGAPGLRAQQGPADPTPAAAPAAQPAAAGTTGAQPTPLPPDFIGPPVPPPRAALAVPVEPIPDGPEQALLQAVDRWRGVLEWAERRLSGEVGRPLALQELPGLRERGRRVIAEAGDLTAQLAPRLADLRARLGDLGAAPAEDQPPEPPAIAARRAALQAALDDALAVQRQIAALVSRANRMVDRVATQRRTALLQHLVTRGPPPLAGTTWRDAARDLERIFGAIDRSWSRWARVQARDGELTATYALLGTAIAVAIVLLWPVYRLAQGRLLRFAEGRSLARAGRLALAGYRVVIVLVFAVLAVAVMWTAVAVAGLWTASLRTVFIDVGFVLVVRRLASVLIRSLTTPRHPEWRLIPVTTRGAWALTWLLSALTLVLGVQEVVVALLGLYDASLPVLTVLDTVSLGVASLLLGAAILVARRSRQPDSIAGPTPEADTSPLRTRLRLVAARVAGAIVSTVPAILLAMVVTGYTALAAFVLDVALGLAVLLAVYLVLRGVLVSLLSYGVMLAVEGSDAAAPLIAGGPVAAAADAPEQRAIRFWLMVAIDLVLLSVAVPLALLLLGMDWAEIQTWGARVLFGFQIGQMTISIADIVVAVLLLVGLMMLTRGVQRILERRVFPRTVFDPGIRNSLTTLVGYVGLSLAVAASVSAIGVDLSSLAIIAGALSVGIGFGLQSIVNNFVSGLILLFERPIKVGDWIVVGGHEGTVKRISVRSTEIETFERSAVIVPNATLISSNVTNWHYKNKVGRVTILVVIGYDADPERVRDILLGIAQKDPDVLRFPASYVFFRGFGEAGLELELRVYLRDIDTILGTASNLRYAIVRRLREEGIPMAVPRRNITLSQDPREGLDDSTTHA